MVAAGYPSVCDCHGGHWVAVCVCVRARALSLPTTAQQGYSVGAQRGLALPPGTLPPWGPFRVMVTWTSRQGLWSQGAGVNVPELVLRAQGHCCLYFRFLEEQPCAVPSHARVLQQEASSGSA